MNVAMLAFSLLSFYGVFALCFWVGLIFALVAGLTSGVFGGDHGGVGHIDHDLGHVGHVGGHGDTGGMDHGVPHFPPFGPVTIGTFITVFGGTGMIFSRLPATDRPYFALPLATACGLGGAVAMFLLFSKVFYSMQGSSEITQQSLIGQTATVSVTIPGDNMGEIVFVTGATRQNVQARSADGETLRTGLEVTITKLVGGTAYVARKPARTPTAGPVPPAAT